MAMKTSKTVRGWQKPKRPTGVAKELNKPDKTLPKVNTQDTRHGKLDLPNFRPKRAK